MVSHAVTSKDNMAPTVAVPEVAALPQDLTTGQQSEERTAAATLGGAASPVGRIALVFVHGMGQQSRFDTMSGAADGLSATLRASTQGGERALGIEFEGPGRAQAGIVANERVEFLSFNVRNPNDKTPLAELHVYESYWAPLTEGVVKLNDVVSFLLKGAIGALLRVRGQFARWIFDKLESFRIPIWSAFHLLAALFVVCSLIALNTIFAFVQSKRFFTASGLAAADSSSATILALTKLVTMPMLFVILFGAVMFASTRFRGNAVLRVVPLVLLPVTLLALVLGAAFGLLVTYMGDRCGTDRAIRYCDSPLHDLLNRSLSEVVTATVVAALLAPLVLIVVAFVMELATQLVRRLYAEREPERRSLSYGVTRGLTFVTVFAMVAGCAYAWFLARRGEQPSGAAVAAAAPLPEWYSTVVWLVLIGVSMGIRRVLVQYVGDVVAYVSSHSLDRFYETRQKVRDIVYKSLRCVYAMKTGDTPVYHRVIVAGHSLGSLAAYDALNRLIAEDEAVRGDKSKQLDVVERTPLLLTFGSPLDKTAFIFAQQATEETRTRAALAATAQPMLMQPTLRPARWVNVWSPWDIISGPLEFYDPVLRRGGSECVDSQRICNIQDDRAATMLYAHVEYWKNTRIYDVLLETIETCVGELRSQVRGA